MWLIVGDFLVFPLLFEQCICLTHLSRMEFPTIINWSSLFPLYGLLGVFFFQFYSNSNRTFSKQTVETLIRHRVLRRLIRVSTVCLRPTKRLIWDKEHTNLRRETCDLFINRFSYPVYHDLKRISQKLTYIKLVLCQYLGTILTINEPVRRYIITHSFIKGSIFPKFFRKSPGFCIGWCTQIQPSLRNFKSTIFSFSHSVS